MDPLRTLFRRFVPQSEPADRRQRPNAAGGYGFRASDDVRVHRFLTLGVEGGTYYTAERALVAEVAPTVLDAARSRGSWLVEQVVAVSTAGRAPRQNPALFALAAVAGLGDATARAAALAALPSVARTGTHLFVFAGYVQLFRGWGRGLRGAVGRWYTGRPVDDVAHQVVKYRNRAGWTHRDLLRLVHPRTDESSRRALFDWVTHGTVGDEVPALVEGFVRAQAADTAPQWVRLVHDHRLSWEMLPDAALVEPDVWRALVTRGLPQTALLRQLPRLTRLGVLTGDVRDTALAQLTDAGRLRSARVHPVSVLVAARTYAAGSGRGTSWTPDRHVVDALDAAFTASFGSIAASGARTLLALDVSGSMVSSAGGLPVSCREVSAALALVTMAIEQDCTVVGFTGGRRGISELSLSGRQRLDDAIRTVSGLPFGATDCAQPMRWAQERGERYDTIVVLTDNETWAGSVHPHVALRDYRERVAPGARLAVVGMTARDVTIADPDDPGSLDVAGFDAAVPRLLADFSRRDV